MLLRRINAHVRSQNWSAVGIDFVIVVVGVFIGIQVSNWNDARSERQLADAYLRLIHNDLQNDVRTLDIRKSFWESVY